MSSPLPEQMLLDVTVPVQPQCCAHITECAVHRMPYDAEFAACTCVVGVGSVRHEAILKDTSVGPSIAMGVPATEAGEPSTTPTNGGPEP
jgi:hypothetical protein